MERTFSSIAPVLLYLPTLLAQSSRRTVTAEEGAAVAGAFLFIVIFTIIAYVFFSFCTWKILQKCGHPNPWMGWVPIVANYAVFQAAGDEKALLWTILSLVPYVGIVGGVMQIIAWVKIFQKLDKSPWLLLLCPTIIGAFVVFGLVALT